MKVLSVRLDNELEDKIEFLVKNRKIIDKSAYIRQLLDKFLSEDILNVLCNQVGEKQLSVWKAAEIAKISLRKMLIELKKRNITGYDEQALKEDLDISIK